MQTRTSLSIIAVAAAVQVSTSVMAGSNGRYSRYDNPRDDRESTDYAQVLSAQPIYSEVRVNQPRQECYDERVVYRDAVQDNYRNNYDASAADRTIGTVVGGLIGGAIGNQFSRGSGRQIATAIGAVVGADIGRNAVNNTYGRDDGYQGGRAVEQVAYEPRCRTINDVRYEQRVQGYDVTYRYNGQVYNTRMPYDPGARLPVQVSVSPLR